MSGQADGLDRLYEGVVSRPDEWGDEALAAWVADVVEGGEVDKASARALRAGVRMARRLRDYWRGRSDVPAWELAVDEALGSRGWRPGLDLARADLERSPSSETYAEVARRFRAVHFQPWNEGTDFEAWAASRGETARE